MLTFLLWCILLVLCWPVALLGLLLYPLVWLLLLPFRIVGIAVDAVLKLLWAIITFPTRLLGAPRRAPLYLPGAATQRHATPVVSVGAAFATSAGAFVPQKFL